MLDNVTVNCLHPPYATMQYDHFRLVKFAQLPVKDCGHWANMQANVQASEWYYQQVLLSISTMCHAFSSRAAKYQSCAVSDTSMKFSRQIILLVTLIFWYSTTLDLTIGDLYSHFCWKFSIFVYISLRHYLTLLKQGFQMKGQFVRNNLELFEVNRWFYSKVMITLIITKFQWCFSIQP